MSENLPDGIHPMLFAFFDSEGRLDREAMRIQVEAAVANGAHGIAMLGLGTEIGKLSREERSQLLQWVAGDLDGRLPLTVTVAEPTVAEAGAAVAAAARAGAACAILQPPPGAKPTEDALIEFFGAVADAAPIPIGVQNAPDYIGVGLSLDNILRMTRLHPNIRILKAEGSALYAGAMVEALQGAARVFNGRGGLELTDNLRAGCSGMIPGVESMDVQVRIFELMRRNTPESVAEAERLYAQILPMLVFLFQSLDSFLCYGKRVAARRLGLGPVHDRAPALAPTPLGLEWTERYATALPPLAIGG